MHRLLLILVLTFYGSVMMFGQTSTNDISDNDKQKLLYIAHKFVKRYQQTRDIAPLLPEFFIGNFGECMTQMGKQIPSATKNELTPQDLVRGYVAEVNSFYIVGVAGTYVDGAGSDDEIMITGLFPPRIAKQFNQMANAHDFLSDSDFSDRRQFLKKLKVWETTISEAQRFLRRKRIEQSTRYLKHFRKEEQGLGRYFIETKTVEEGFPCKVSTRGLGRPTRTYIVFTPLGLELILVSIRGNFKVVMAYPPTD